MRTKKKTVEKYELKEPDPMIAEEPLLPYGGLILNLDETQRYTYADYLTWFDDKRREKILFQKN
jgi:hypothetical protein